MLNRIAAWLATLALCVGVVFATSYGFSPASTHVEWQLVDVSPTMSVADLADRLEELGLIRSKVCFLAAARLSGESGHLEPGQYKLSPSMTPVQIVEKIARGQVATDWVVVPEGFTVREIERLLEKHGLAKPDRFDRAARWAVRHYRDRLDIQTGILEGYLFPDTYLIPKPWREERILSTMLDRFEHAVLHGLRSDLRRSPNGLTFPETLILASLVEKEARHDEERAHIAGVLINRLRNGMKLECDAAIEYALPSRKKHLSYEDTRIESPYNTYLHRGLPPTPICCPGLASIRAAIQPAGTPDLYYVAGPDGYHQFSQTLAEHNQARKRLRDASGLEMPAPR